MNKFLNKLERKIGKYCISNLSLYIIIGYVIGYILSITGTMEFIALNPYKIIHGQVWRIITWILVPPSSLNLFTVIMLFFYYSIGTSLERTWGTFRYNLYIFSGIIFSVLGAFILNGIYSLFGYPAVVAGDFIAGAFSTYYINLSIFLAFAAEYPDMQVLLYFIIPLKIKWLAIFDLVVIGLSFISGNLALKVAIIASLLNFILFFLGTRNYRSISPREIHRKRTYRKATAASRSGSTASSISKHKCAICGRTEKDGELLEFRFCSKCNGNYEYCQEHLFSHSHVQ